MYDARSQKRLLPTPPPLPTIRIAFVTLCLPACLPARPLLCIFVRPVLLLGWSGSSTSLFLVCGNHVAKPASPHPHPP